MTRLLQKRWILLAIPALLVLLSGLRTLAFDFVYDDNTVVLAAPEVVRQDGWSLFFSPSPTKRPLPTLSFALDQQIFGRWAGGYHLVSVLWASVNAALVAWLALVISASRRAALAAGVLFAVHPVHVEAMCNISSRTDLMAFTFGVSGIGLLCLRIREARLPPPGALVAGMLLASASILCKEVDGAGIFGFLMLLPFLSLTTQSGSLRRRLQFGAVPLLLAVVGGALLIQRHQLLYLNALARPPAFAHATGGQIQTLGDWLLRSLAGTAQSFLLLLWPVNLSADHAMPPGASWGLVLAVAGLLLLVAAPVAGLLIGRRNLLAGFGLLWLTPTLVPVINVLPLSEFFVAERRLYVPSLGAAFVGAALLDWLAGRGQRHADERSAARETSWQPAWVITLAVIAVLGLGWSVARAGVWSNRDTLWQATLKENPRSFRALNHAGDLSIAAGNFQEAEQHYQRAVEYAPFPGQSTTLCKIGAVRLQLGRAAEALQAFNRAVYSYSSDDPQCRFNRGLALLKVDDVDGAIKDMHIAIEGAPDDVVFRVKIFEVYMNQEQHCEAWDTCQEIARVMANRPVPRSMAEGCKMAREKCLH